ncbi:MAG: hypothetical protein DI570_05815 [Phenylobacterium zucineum]|nr:MAG: hypothetical protein DI570_05815 [Phenylobacterium zucineum]
MTSVSFRKAKYRLASQLRTGPGLSRSTALQRAEAAVAGMREQLLAELDAKIAAAEAALADALRQKGGPALDVIYDCGDGLAGIAGACGQDAVADAALGACDLIDWMRSEQRWSANALTVHVSAFRVLKDDQTGAAAPAVLDGLAKVRARVFATTGEG